MNDKKQVLWDCINVYTAAVGTDREKRERAVLDQAIDAALADSATRTHEFTEDGKCKHCRVEIEDPNCPTCRLSAGRCWPDDAPPEPTLEEMVKAVKALLESADPMESRDVYAKVGSQRYVVPVKRLDALRAALATAQKEGSNG